jgi:hypothetical protein
VTLGNRTFTGHGTFAVPGLSPGVYDLALPNASGNGANLTEYVPSDHSTSFASAGGAGILVDSNGTISVTYSPWYIVALTPPTDGGLSLSLVAGPPGVSGPPNATWYQTGSTLNASAQPNAGFLPVALTVNGSTTNRSFLVFPVDGPTTVSAAFVRAAPANPGTYALSLVETGLPDHTVWSLTSSAGGVSGTAGTLTVSGINGSVSYSVPTVYLGADTRFLPNGVAWFNDSIVPSGLGLNVNLSVTFTEQFLLTVSASSGGTVTPGIGGWWEAAGTQVSLIAVSNATSTFSSWNGSGATGDYSGTAVGPTVTMNGPVVEVATFVPIYHSSTSGSSTSGEGTAVALLVVLLVVGAVAGFLIARRPRRPDAEPSEHDAAPSEPEAPTEEWDEGPSSGPVPDEGVIYQ